MYEKQSLNNAMPSNTKVHLCVSESTERQKNKQKNIKIITNIKNILYLPLDGWRSRTMKMMNIHLETQNTIRWAKDRWDFYYKASICRGHNRS